MPRAQFYIRDDRYEWLLTRAERQVFLSFPLIKINVYTQSHVRDFYVGYIIAGTLTIFHAMRMQFDERQANRKKLVTRKRYQVCQDVRFKIQAVRDVVIMTRLVECEKITSCPCSIEIPIENALVMSTKSDRNEWITQTIV